MTVASLQNMRRLYRPGVFAYSPHTGEQCSANPDDYFFWLPEGQLLRDSTGHVMQLVVRQVSYIDVGKHNEGPEGRRS